MKQRIDLTDRDVKKRAGSQQHLIDFAGRLHGRSGLPKTSVTTPDVFRGSPTPTPDAHSFADLKWFEVFKDEQLQELIRTALVQNYDLRDAVARVDAARANLGITQADQYPNFGVGGGFGSIQVSRQGQFSIPSGTRRHDFGTVFLNLFSFEIDIWGRLRRATEAARAELLATDWNRKTVITTLVSDVATAYFNLLELDMELAIAKNTLATRAGIATADQNSSARRCRNAFGRATGRAAGLWRGADDTEHRAANRANRKSNQFAAGQKSRVRNARPLANGAANTSRSACRIALLAPREASRHPGSGANPSRDQC